MKIAFLLAAALTAGLFAAGMAPADASAQDDPSGVSAVSALPLASVMVSGAVAGSAVAAPVALLASGGMLLVKAVEVSARGVVYVLARASDGAVVSVEVIGGGLSTAAVAVGSMMTVSVIGAGTLLSAAGEVIAFIPNALGRALLHNERLSH